MVKKHGSYGYAPTKWTNRTIQLTEKGERALEHARRKRLYPELDPEKDWIEIPTWMLTRDNVH